MRNDLGVAIILLTGVAVFGGVFVLSRPSTAAGSVTAQTFAVQQPVYTISPAMDLPPVKRDTALDEPAAPAGPPPAFSTQTSLSTLLANPDARAVVFQDLPALANVSGAQIAMVGTMSLRTVQSLLPAILTDAALKKLDQDLAEIPAPTAAPPPTPAIAAMTPQPADPAAQAPPTQAAAFSSRSTLSSLLGNPAARAVLMREIPALAQAPQAQLELAAGLSLRDIQRLMPPAVTDAAIERVDQGLAALTATAATTGA